MKGGDVFFTVVILLLVILMASLLFLISSEELPEWQVPTGENIMSAAAGEDGSIFVLTGDPTTPEVRTLYSVTKDGLKRWELPVATLLSGSEEKVKIQGQILSAGTTAAYVYLQWETPSSNSTEAWNHLNYSTSGGFYAISRSGKLLWSLPDNLGIHYATTQTYINPEDGLLWRIPGNPDSIYGHSVNEQGRRTYLFDGHSVIILNNKGEVLSVIEWVSSAPAIGSDGYVYTMRDLSTEAEKSSEINAYYPNGTLYWSKLHNRLVLDSYYDYYSFTTGTNLLDLIGVERTAPLYHNGTVYVVYYDEILALDQDGTGLWNLPLNSTSNTGYTIVDRFVPYWPALFDSAGNLYVLKFTDRDSAHPELLAISQNGVASAVRYDPRKDYRAARGDLVYYVNDSPEMYSSYEVLGKYYNYSDSTFNLLHVMLLSGYTQYVKPDRLDNLSPVTISWGDVRSGSELSCVRLPVGEVKCATVTTANVDRFFKPEDAEIIRYVNIYNGLYGDPLYGALNVTAPTNFGHVYLDVLPAGNVTYVSLYTYNTQDPVTLGRTPIYYFSAIYAIDRDGHILWTKPTDFGADLIDADNTTVYYSTNDGRIGSAGVYVAGGLTLAGILYAVLKFFSAGVISRARSRLDKNENRTEVLQFVISHPGSTLREIARGTELNLGTIRYHMFILGMNHKVVSFQSDGKHVRYFQNSNTYSREEQLVLSLAKRDKIHYLLKKIYEQPGMSNRELAQALALPDSAVSRYLKELASTGIVERELRADGSPAYSIKSGYRQFVESTVCGTAG